MHTPIIRFLCASDGTLSIGINGKLLPPIRSDHPHYTQIIEALRTKDIDRLVPLTDIPRALSATTNGRVRFDAQSGVLFYKDQPVHNTLAKMIRKICGMCLPFDHFVAFYEHLTRNPSRRAVTELYPFLEHHDIPICVSEPYNGWILAYKRLRPDWTDCHTGQIQSRLHEPTAPLERNEVDDNFGVLCSDGYHAGNDKYVRGFENDHNPPWPIVIVAVNPRDVVSVPSEGDKFRCTTFTPVTEVDPGTLDKSPLYEASRNTVTPVGTTPPTAATVKAQWDQGAPSAVVAPPAADDDEEDDDDIDEEDDDDIDEEDDDDIEEEDDETKIDFASFPVPDHVPAAVLRAHSGSVNADWRQYQNAWIHRVAWDHVATSIVEHVHDDTANKTGLIVAHNDDLGYAEWQAYPYDELEFLDGRVECVAGLTWLIELRSSGDIKIGCNTFSITHWRKNLDTIADRYGIDEAPIEKYRDAIEALAISWEHETPPAYVLACVEGSTASDWVPDHGGWIHKTVCNLRRHPRSANAFHDYVILSDCALDLWGNDNANDTVMFWCREGYCAVPRTDHAIRGPAFSLNPRLRAVAEELKASFTEKREFNAALFPPPPEAAPRPTPPVWLFQLQPFSRPEDWIRSPEGVWYHNDVGAWDIDVGLVHPGLVLLEDMPHDALYEAGLAAFYAHDSVPRQPWGVFVAGAVIGMNSDNLMFLDGAVVSYSEALRRVERTDRYKTARPVLRHVIRTLGTIHDLNG